MTVPRSKIPITLGGKTRYIVMSFNALCDAELALGRDIFNEELTVQSPSVIRVLLWAGLKHEWPSVTVEMVGDMLDNEPGGFVNAMAAVAQALDAALPDADQETAGAEGNATGSQ